MWLLDSLLFPLLNAPADAHHGWLVFAAFASSVFPSLAALVLASLAVQGRPGMRAAVGQALLSMAFAWLAVHAIRKGFPAPRPAAMGQGLQWLPHGVTSSFPSQHAAGSFACWWGLAGAGGNHRLRKLGAAFLLVAVVIAWSRVYLGLHFPTDLLGGALVGITMAGLAHWLWDRLAPHAFARWQALPLAARRTRGELAEG